MMSSKLMEELTKREGRFISIDSTPLVNCFLKIIFIDLFVRFEPDG